jgi:hypothetical protein
MQPEDQLASLLARINTDALRDFSIEKGPAPDHIVASTRPVTEVGPYRELSSDFRAQLRGAILAFRDRVEPGAFRTLRLQCLGCCTYFPDHDYALLRDAPAMQRLLLSVRSYRDDPYRLRRLIDGLLHAYLGVDRQAPWFAEQQTRQGNEQLRAFIGQAFYDIAALEPTPDWVLVLQAYPEVLSGEPGNRFSNDLLYSKGAEFQDMSRRLRLTGDCWLAAETLRSALYAAAATNDDAFVSLIPALLNAAGQPSFRPMRDEIYAGLLTRYIAMGSQPAHPELRDALVAAWKNPWLARNDSAWTRVPEAARKLVAGWLKLDLIHQFFEVLSEDGKQDRSRFDFWRRYHQEMDDVYFALGGRAYASRSPDMVTLRSALDGRLLELVGTEADNNAFIMCFADTVVVEFSKKGNAAYRYTRGQLDLIGARRSIGIGELRQDATQRLIHRDTRDGQWQDRFTAALRRGSQSWARPSSQGVPSHRTVRPMGVIQRSTHTSLHSIQAFAQSAKIVIEDHRSKGGSLWLRIDNADPDISRLLAGWGFRYRPGRGWWRAT